MGWMAGREVEPEEATSPLDGPSSLVKAFGWIRAASVASCVCGVLAVCACLWSTTILSFTGGRARRYATISTSSLALMPFFWFEPRFHASSLWSSSHKMIEKLYTSDGLPTVSLRSTSGDMYAIVPQKMRLKSILLRSSERPLRERKKQETSDARR